ncbi:MAG TPA: WecB/TagA/CpsF family glycosyltransferase [Planctomycetota bacterium]|nr:WecB/TagA/CpsF family glycosyltransferase [Planctomycetota bacterium]
MNAPASSPFPRLNILGSRIASVNYAEAVEIILARANEYKPGAYVCAANVHCVSMARRDPAYRAVLNAALLTVPDGMPLVWAHKILGGRRLKDRVYGPTLMLHLCAAAAQRGVPIYLYGGAPSVPEKLAEILKQGLPQIQIAGVCAPPFGDRAENDPQLLREIDAINSSGARLIFVALGAPKQEFFMAHYSEKIVPVQIGVGAAFNFHTGTVRQAPAWMQGAGLEWLYRFCVEPRRLWKRYLLYNPYFLARLALQRAGLDAAAKNDERTECPNHV